jgi:hypothetical protein
MLIFCCNRYGAPLQSLHPIRSPLGNVARSAGVASFGTRSIQSFYYVGIVVYDVASAA